MRRLVVGLFTLALFATPLDWNQFGAELDRFQRLDLAPFALAYNTWVREANRVKPGTVSVIEQQRWIAVESEWAVFEARTDEQWERTKKSYRELRHAVRQQHQGER